jgi:hypothetical protein
VLVRKQFSKIVEVLPHVCSGLAILSARPSGVFKGHLSHVSRDLRLHRQSYNIEMSFFPWSRRQSSFAFVLVTLCAVQVYGKLVVPKLAGELTVPEIEQQLQACPLVQELNKHRAATHAQTSSLTSQIFGVLFPGSPAVNAILATIYISGPPSMISVQHEAFIYPY